MEEKGQTPLGRTQEAHDPACLLQERHTQALGTWPFILGYSASGSTLEKALLCPKQECMHNLGLFALGVGAQVCAARLAASLSLDLWCLHLGGWGVEEGAWPRAYVCECPRRPWEWLSMHTLQPCASCCGACWPVRLSGWLSMFESRGKYEQGRPHA